MATMEWNPGQYLKFDRERNQPCIDLITRINFRNPRSIVDIGCGPGNSTNFLVKKWPESKVTGMDNSPAMIERAGKDFPDMEWRLLDAGKDEIAGKFDIVFSNAAIQWIPDNYDLFKKFRSILNDNGIVAVQVPLFFEMPIGKSLRKIAMGNRWKDTLKKVDEIFSVHSTSEYYNYLTELFGSAEMWVTYYFHAMDSHESILEMMRSTGMKPYLDRLESENDKVDFEKEVLEEIRENYPSQKNGRVLFPFKRLFFIAEKRNG